jgi:hypothetical protein
MPYGQDASIGIALQNSFGTQANVGSIFQIPLLSEDVGLAQEELISQNLNGRFDEGDAYSGQRQFGGQLECEAQPLALGALLTAVINDPVQTQVESFVQSYVFTPRTSDFDANIPNRPVSYYKHLKDSNSAQLFYDLGGARFELQQSAGGFLLARTNFVGGKRATVGSQALTLDESPRWPWNTASLSLAAAAVDDFTDMTITHDEGLEARFTLDGSLVANRIKRSTSRTVRVAGTLIFETQDELDNFVDETTQAMVITFRGTTEIQSGYFDTLTIDMPAFKWLDYKPVVRGPGEIEVSFTGKADYHASSGTSIQYTLQNTYAAGYTA